MAEQRKRPEITLDLLNWLESYLNLNEHRDLAEFSHLAEVIEIKLQNLQLFKVIHYPNEEHFDWSGVHVWRWDSYITDHRKWLVDRERAEKERIAKYIFDENIRRLTPRMRREFCVNEEHAVSMAISAIRNNRVNLFKFIGYKVVTKVEEI